MNANSAKRRKERSKFSLLLELARWLINLVLVQDQTHNRTRIVFNERNLGIDNFVKELRLRIREHRKLLLPGSLHEQAAPLS